MRMIISTRPANIDADDEGGLDITSPAREMPRDAGMTDAQIEQRAFDALPPEVLNPAFIEESDVPLDRTFRNALENVGGKPVHSMVKAKLIAHEVRREKRDIEMKPWDDIVMKNIPGQDAAAAEVERKKIRDADTIKQNAMNNAPNITALKALL